MRTGTIVYATLIAAPPSTKNREGKRDGDMHQARKGNQGHNRTYYVLEPDISFARYMEEGSFLTFNNQAISMVANSKTSENWRRKAAGLNPLDSSESDEIRQPGCR